MSDWRLLAMSRDTTIRQAMQIIDRGAHRIGLVCDAEDRLVATVSDGDLRRGLLADRQMDDPVSTVMNAHPKTVRLGAGRDDALDLMRRHDVAVLPIVDAGGRIQGIESLRSLLERPEMDNPVFIMAGGFGTRLRPLTDACPKPMLKVGDKPMLAHIVGQFERAGFRRIYISTHYLPEKIREYFGDGSRFGVDITYVHEEEPLGTGGALGLLPAGLPDLPLIMMNGDVLTRVDFQRLLRHHAGSGAQATMCVREYEYQVPFGVVESAEELVTGMVEKPSYRYHVNTGIYVIEPAVVRSVAPGTVIDMPTVLEELMARGEKVGLYNSFDYWLDIGRIDDYERAQVDVTVIDA